MYSFWCICALCFFLFVEKDMLSSGIILSLLVTDTFLFLGKDMLSSGIILSLLV